MNSQEAYNDVIGEFPVLAAIADMFNCACAVDAYGADLVNDFLAAADFCGDFVGDLGSALAELGGAFGEAGKNLGKSFGCLATLGGWSGCAGSGPGLNAPCYAFKCAAGQQCYPYEPGTKNLDWLSSGEDKYKDCGPCNQVAYAVALEPGTCGCGGGFVASYENIFGGPPFGTKLLTSCDCPTPFSKYYELNQQHPLGHWTCACPLGQSLIGGKCALTCAPDQHAVPKKGGSKDGSVVLVGDVWSCEACPPNTTSTGHGPCRQLCAPNEHLVTDPVDAS